MGAEVNGTIPHHRAVDLERRQIAEHLQPRPADSQEHRYHEQCHRELAPSVAWAPEGNQCAQLSPVLAPLRHSIVTIRHLGFSLTLSGWGAPLRSVPTRLQLATASRPKK